MNGKGSKRRPAQVPEKQVRDNWDRVDFRKKPLVVYSNPASDAPNWVYREFVKHSSP